MEAKVSGAMSGLEPSEQSTILNILIDYGSQMVHPQTGQYITPKEVTMNFIVWCVKNTYKTIGGEILQTWANIQTKLEDCVINKKSEIISLTKKEVEFLQITCLNKQMQFGVNEARYAVIFLAEMRKQLGEYKGVEIEANS